MIKFDVDIVTKSTKFMELRPKQIPVFKIIEKEIPYIIITTDSFPSEDDIGYIYNEIYTDVVDLCIEHNAVGIKINPSTLDIDTIVLEDTVLDDVEFTLKQRYANRLKNQIPDNKDNPKR